MSKCGSAIAPTTESAAQGSRSRPFGRTLADFGVLSRSEAILLECCRRGEEAVVGEVVPVRGTSRNRVRASFVRFLALGGDDQAPVHEYGVALKGAWLTGTLSIEDAAVPFSLSLDRCRIEYITAWRSTIPILLLRGSLLRRGLQAEGLRANFGLWLGDGFTAEATVNLRTARIGGDLDICDAHLRSRNGAALDFDFAEIAGSVLMNGTSATGRVNFAGATIKGDFSCVGSSFSASEGFAMFFDGAAIGRSVFLREGFRATGGVRLLAAKIGSTLDFSGGCFEAPGEYAIDAEGAQVGSSIFFHGFSSTGLVSLHAACIGGALECLGSHFENAGRVALSCSSASISASVLLSDGFAATGEVSFTRAVIGGHFNCGGAQLSNAQGAVLTLDDATVGHSIFFTNGFRASGATLLRGVKVGRNLVCWDCEIEYVEFGSALARSLDPMDEEDSFDALSLDRAVIGRNILLGSGFRVKGAVNLFGAIVDGTFQCGGEIDNEGFEALTCRRASIRGNVRLRGPFHAKGSVSFHGASIGGDLDCNGGRFEGSDGIALDAESAAISGRVFLTDGFHATQDVWLIGASIGRSLLCNGGRFESPNGIALSCDLAEVKGGFFFRDVRSLEGAVDLSAMRVSTLCDDLASWSGARGQVVLDGFVYDRFAGGAPTTAGERIAWLNHQPPGHVGEAFRPQPWEQLIVALRAMGHANTARTVAIARNDSLRGAGKVVRGARALHWLYGALVGYGYRPARLLAAVVVVWLICAGAYALAAYPPQGIPRFIAPVARQNPPTYDSFSPLIYSADVLLPIVDLGHGDEWLPVVDCVNKEAVCFGRRLRELRWLEILLGWLFGGALAAMLGNLIKKD